MFCISVRKIKQKQYTLLFCNTAVFNLPVCSALCTTLQCNMHYENVKFITYLATSKEITSFKIVVGKLLFIGHLTHPICLRIASYMVSKTTKLFLHHLKDLEALILYERKLTPFVKFLPVK